MKILLTGSSGFIGKKLFDTLLSSSHDFHLISRKFKKDSINIKNFKIDLCKSVKFPLLAFEGVDVVCHCAGEVSNEGIMRTLHVQGLMSMLSAIDIYIQQSNKPIHWVQLSSAGAYGPPTDSANAKRVVDETTPCNPVGEYEVTKTEADALVVDLASRQALFTYTILRPTNVVGDTMPNQSFNSLISMIKNGLFFYVGSRTSIATYVHVNDVVRALCISTSDYRAKNEIFNLSNDCMFSEIVNSIHPKKRFVLCISEPLLRCIIFCTSWIKFNPLKKSRINALVNHTHYSSKKIIDILDFKFEHSISRFSSLIANTI